MTTAFYNETLRSIAPSGEQNLRRFFSVLVAASLIVTVLRFFTKTELGYDLTIQIQAAQHLLQGKGLTIFVSSKNYFSENELVTLTHWPSGFSFYTAAVLGLGLPLALVTKIYGAVLTIIGWWGWGRFMMACLGGSILAGGARFLLACFFAVVFPLFTTPVWDGTDIFLWAAVPWVLGWLALAPSVGGQKEFYYYGLAGLVCGLCCIMRYGSAVLAAYAGLVIFLQSIPSLSIFLKRCLVFGLSALPFLALQYYIILTAVGFVEVGGIDSGGGGLGLMRVSSALKLLPNLNTAIFYWLPNSLLRHLVGADNLPFAAYLLTLLILFAPLFIFAKARFNSPREALQDVRFLASGFVVVVPIFLIYCMLHGSFPFVREPRYYLPLIPLALFLMFYMCEPSVEPASLFVCMARRACLIFMYGFTVTSIFYMFFLFIPGAHGNVIRKKLMEESDLSTFPSCGLAYDNSPMRRYVVERLRADPSLFLMTNFEAMFYADPSLNQKRIHRIPGCESLKGATASGPLRILVVAIDDGQELNYFQTVDAFGMTTPVLCLNDLPNTKLVKTFDETLFPATRIKVLESVIPEGSEYRIQK